MISYNEILTVIETFVDGHKFDLRFEAEFYEQLPNLSTEDLVFPIVFVEPLDGDTGNNTDVTEINVYCLDRLRKDRKNTNDVISDTKQILSQDLTRWLEEGQQDIEIDRSYPATPHNNYLLDYTAGWSMRIRVQNERISICEVPYEGSEPTPVECDPVTVENSDSDILGTPASGSTFTVGDSVITLDDSDGNTLNTTNVPAEDTETIVAGDTNVQNSDGSYNVDVLAEGSLVVPDLNVSNSDDSYSVNVPATIDHEVPDTSVRSYNSLINVIDSSFYPSAVNGQVTIGDSEITLNSSAFLDVPATVTQDIELLDQNTDPIVPDSVVGNVITVDIPEGGAQSTMLMGTGLQTSYRTGDDKDINAGRENGSFYVLSSNNPFGNTDRFTDTLGGQTYANDIVIDWAHRDYTAGTVLSYYRVLRVATSWNDAIDTALALSITGFTTGWYLPNMVELNNLIQVSTDATVILYPLNYAPFNFTNNLNYWTSTTRPISTPQAIKFFNNSAYANNTAAKTTAGYSHFYARHTLLTELGL